MTCERHGGSSGSVMCRECDLEIIEKYSNIKMTRSTDNIVKRTCRDCDGTGYIEVDVDMERFRHRLGFYSLLIGVVVLAGYNIWTAVHTHHIRMVDWFVLCIVGWGVWDMRKYR